MPSGGAVVGLDIGIMTARLRGFRPQLQRQARLEEERTRPLQNGAIVSLSTSIRRTTVGSGRVMAPPQVACRSDQLRGTVRVDVSILRVSMQAQTAPRDLEDPFSSIVFCSICMCSGWPSSTISNSSCEALLTFPLSSASDRCILVSLIDLTQERHACCSGAPLAQKKKRRKEPNTYIDIQHLSLSTHVSW